MAALDFRGPSRALDNGVYFYHRYTAGARGCDSDRGDFYVLGIVRMDGAPSGSTHPESSGFGVGCTGFGWDGTGAWLTG